MQTFTMFRQAKSNKGTTTNIMQNIHKTVGESKDYASQDWLLGYRIKTAQIAKYVK